MVHLWLAAVSDAVGSSEKRYTENNVCRMCGAKWNRDRFERMASGCLGWSRRLVVLHESLRLFWKYADGLPTSGQERT